MATRRRKGGDKTPDVNDKPVQESSETPSVRARDDSTSPLELFGLIFVIMCICFGGLYVHLKSPALPADPFLVIDIPGRGKGVVAARDIQAGELLIRESPLFVVPQHITSSPTTLLQTRIGQLTQEEVYSFYNLSYVHLPKGVDPEKSPEEVALAIMQTNAVSAGDGVGIFPRMARLNHGCAGAFNAVYSWRDAAKEIVVHALKDIKEGDEVLTTYTDTKRPRDERREFLSTHYGFNCTCAICSLTPELSQASDQRLTTMAKLYSKFGLWSSGKITGKEAIEIARKIWALGEKEGYWSERGRLADDALMVAAAHSDASAARGWAYFAVNWYTFELGWDSEQAEGLRGQKPEWHPAWGTRERMDVGGPSTMVSHEIPPSY